MHEIMQESRPSEFLIEENEEPPSGEETEEPPSGLAALPFQQALSAPFVITPVHSFPVPSFVHPRRGTRTSPPTRAFRKRFYPQVMDSQWNDWHWQIANRIRTLAQAETMLHLSAMERDALVHLGTSLPFGVTPYYMSLVSPDNPHDALRRCVIPTVHEQMTSPGEADDPLGEDAQSPVPGLVHRYPDRVLFLLSDFCSTYCRYCTRSRVVGHGALTPQRDRLEAAMAYIRRTPTVRDVLLSGGDPLTMGEEKLEWVLKGLRSIPHVEIIRIGTKVPAVLPQRITPALVRMLKRYHPLWISVHFTHPDECTPESTRACALLADAGIPLGSQTVLLKGINDEVDTMTDLVHRLLKMRVRPYYLYQCDPISGSAHFRTQVEKGLEIIRGLRGFTSGYAVPTFVIDAPGGGGKVPLMPDYVAGRQGDALILRNYENRFFSYPDAADVSCPQGLYQ
jgi:lysine 2,3-aminomutase